MQWRLALDMGTNSLGWVAFRLDQHGEVLSLLDTGVRIFSDGREPSSKDRVGESLAVERRLARGSRRNRDRKINRKNDFLRRLIELGLMPADQIERKLLEKLNPYYFRAKAAEEKISTYELGRTLFHLNQRRGYKSNRKSDSDDEESGVIKPKISELRTALGRQTLGQWFNQQLNEGKAIRFRGEDGDLYADRAMYEQEFDKIREIQQEYHALSDNDWDDLRNGNKAQKFDGIFYQRPLKDVERGRCEFLHEEYRAFKDHPAAHEFRILQEIANLQYYGDNFEKHELDDNQRSAIIEKLEQQKTLSFGKIRQLKNPDGSHLFPRGCQFNLENGPRDKLNGNSTSIDMRNEKMLGTSWHALSQQDQNKMIDILHDAQDDNILIQELQDKFSLKKQQAIAVSKFKISSATTHLSVKFMLECSKIMREDGIGYVEAITGMYDEDGVYFHHSHRQIDKLLNELPYYGQVLSGSMLGAKPNEFNDETHPEQHYGKINNPTVHVALNQLRKLINCLIERFGAPTEIHIELVRDLKKTAKARNDIAKQNKQFAKANDARAKLYRDLNNGREPSGLDLKKIRLWEELGTDSFARLCPFSGNNISTAMLFNGEAEIEHILPFSRSLDNGSANLTIATRQTDNSSSAIYGRQEQVSKNNYHPN